MRAVLTMRMPVIVLVVRVFHARRDGHFRRRLRIQLLAEQQHHSRAQQREQRNQPDLVEKVHAVYHFSKSISSASTVSLLRNSAIRMPSPTAASATASVITKIAKICPSTFCQYVREGDQVDVHGVEDQLDGHQNDHDVAAGQHADGTDQQQRGAQD